MAAHAAHNGYAPSAIRAHHDLHKIPKREFKTHIPSYARDDDFTIKMPPRKQTTKTDTLLHHSSPKNSIPTKCRTRAVLKNFDLPGPLPPRTGDASTYESLNPHIGKRLQSEIAHHQSRAPGQPDQHTDCLQFVSNIGYYTSVLSLSSPQMSISSHPPDPNDYSAAHCAMGSGIKFVFRALRNKTGG